MKVTCGRYEFEEIFEFDDNVTDETIQIDFDMWVQENTTQDTYWEEVKEE